MFEQRLSACDRERVLETRRLRARDLASERRQLIRSPPLVVFRRERRRADQPVGKQPLDDP
jgi:hypothetical protein